MGPAANRLAEIFSAVHCLRFASDVLGGFPLSCAGEGRVEDPELGTADLSGSVWGFGVSLVGELAGAAVVGVGDAVRVGGDGVPSIP